jgi:acetoin utilization deacetylase AcuC-like enzyme
MSHRTVGFISDAVFALHDTGPSHPERPDRLRAVHRGLREAGLLDGEDAFPKFKLDVGGSIPWSSRALSRLGYRAARDEDLLLTHSAEHIAYVARLCVEAGRSASATFLDTGDTVVCPRSDELARGSVGAAISAVDAVLDGTVERCFVASRPPGHHAEPERAMGFCLYSNIAIAARHAKERRGLGRVAVVDFDVHHGNGTQACLGHLPDYLFISLHQHPQSCYPGTGFEWEIGVGAGRGFTMNVPLPPTSGDRTYMTAMEGKVIPRLREFKPDLLLLSAGFDAHADDPLADMEVSDEGFTQITRALMDASDALCQGRVVSLLEGGYNLPALARCSARHVIELQRAF